MPDIELRRLRALRESAETLFSTLVTDLRPFRAKDESLGFRRKPNSTPDGPNDVNVTTTCSCIMGLAHAGQLKELYVDGSKSTLENILRNMMNAPWKSSGLAENNAFTTTLVIRMFGSLIKSGDLDEGAAVSLRKAWNRGGKASKSQPKLLSEIARELAKKVAFLGIQPYPPAAAVVYWFLDGVDHSEIDLRNEWEGLFRYATEEFRRQRSLVVATHTAMMDPIAMAMAACLCARLHTILKRTKSTMNGCSPDLLPTMIELESAVMDLFKEQTPSGLWPKYFPLFHYKDAGSNFCYTFELLEAVLLEFGQQDNHILLNEAVISGLEKAVMACAADRLESTGPKDGDGTETIQYSGWNSGGNLETLRKGQPESWATAVVHMFLRELITALSRHIQKRLLKEYDAKTYHTTKPGLKGLLDIRVQVGADDHSLRDILQRDLVDSFASSKGENAENLLGTPVKKKPLSALLFGPPGTSKTEVAKALAAELRWPLVEIDPSHFLRNTFQNIYVQAESIFKDVMDMYGVVVLFDELDALVQTRDTSGSPDTESKFLTTYMLPKLAKLHDRGRLVFLMATNYQENFDEAIKRAGRFDRLLCMGPPTLEEKCRNLAAFLGAGKETKSGGASLLAMAEKDQFVYDQLTLYTYGEFKSFLSQLGTADSIESNLTAKKQGELHALVEGDSKTVGMKLQDLQILNQPPYGGAWTPGNWTELSQLYRADFQKIEVKKPTPALKYILERQRSKFQ